MEYTHDLAKPRLDKLVVNIGVGKSGEELVKAESLLEKLTSKKPARTTSTHKIPAWGLKKGEPIGCKVTLRGSQATEFLKRVLSAKDNQLKARNFDKNGNLSFGISEYIDIPGIKYDPDIGIAGLNVNISFKRPGFRVRDRRIRPVKTLKKAALTALETQQFIKHSFGVEIE